MRPQTDSVPVHTHSGRHGVLRAMTLLQTALLFTFTAALPAPLAVAKTRHHRQPPRRTAPIRCMSRLPPGASAAAVRSPRRRRPMTNPFGPRIFGIATGGDIHQEGSSLLSRDIGVEHEAGVRWLRIDINWAVVQMHGRGTYVWRPFDRVVRQAQACGMSILGTILYTPDWARPRGTDSTWAPDPGLYGEFAGRAASHFAALGVHAYEIWNEPNTASFWQPRPNPVAYTHVLQAAYAQIKAADPTATVVTGGTSPALSDANHIAPVQWLSDLYAAGAQGHFDAVGHHPYCWPAYPGAPQNWSAWYQMYGTSPSLRSLMISHGDGGKTIWATEFGAPTGGPAGSHVTEAAQAAMVARGYRLFARYSWAGPLFLYQGRDAGSDPSTREDFFGFLHHNFAAKPAYNAYASTARSY